MPNKKYTTVEVVILLLTVGIVLFLFILILKSLLSDIPMSDGRVEILDSILTSIISIVSMYIGSKLNNNN
jgi:hypothetical protein